MVRTNSCTSQEEGLVEFFGLELKVLTCTLSNYCHTQECALLCLSLCTYTALRTWELPGALASLIHMVSVCQAGSLCDVRFCQGVATERRLNVLHRKIVLHRKMLKYTRTQPRTWSVAFLKRVHGKQKWKAAENLRTRHCSHILRVRCKGTGFIKCKSENLRVQMTTAISA